MHGMHNFQTYQMRTRNMSTLLRLRDIVLKFLAGFILLKKIPLLYNGLPGLSSLLLIRRYSPVIEGLIE